MNTLSWYNHTRLPQKGIWGYGYSTTLHAGACFEQSYQESRTEKDHYKYFLCRSKCTAEQLSAPPRYYSPKHTQF